MAAAVGAARCGARVALVERAPFLGGAATFSGVLTYCGFWTQAEPPRRAVGGIGGQVLAGIDELGGLDGPRRMPVSGVVVALIEPEAVKLALDRCCAAAGVEVILHATLCGAGGDGGGIGELQVLDHAGTFALEAAAFVDASGEADLAAFAGAATRYGNGDRVQNGTLSIRLGGVAAGADASRSAWERAVTAAKARDPHAALSKEHGFVARMKSGEIVAFLADEAYDARDARSIAGAERRAREQAWAYLNAVRTLPGYENAYLIATGPSIGTRESRHIVARAALRDRTVLETEIGADAVALGAWPVEEHPGPGLPSRWIRLRNDGAYGIPLDALRSVDRANLFAAGRVIDAEPHAFASARVMGTAFATGHAAGVAAALSAGGSPPRPDRVRAELASQGAILDLSERSEPAR